jgi:hypothetical protein
VGRSTEGRERRDREERGRGERSGRERERLLSLIRERGREVKSNNSHRVKTVPNQSLQNWQKPSNNLGFGPAFTEPNNSQKITENQK